MALTVNDRERHAYVSGDLATLELIDLIELERDDAPAPSAELAAYVDGWESNAWCLGRVVEALQTAGPLKKSQMRLLAVELEGLVCRLPRKGREELDFRDRVFRACGLGE